MPDFGQFEVKTHASNAKQLQNDWTATLMQSAKVAAMQGKLPGSMARLVGELKNPTVPWHQVLRAWLREQASDDYDFMRPAMEYSDGDFIIPSLRSERMGPVVMAKDTSGSIDGPLLAQYVTEQQAVLDDMKPSRLVDICCDAAIQRVKEFFPGDTVDNKAPGGGGTDFRPIFQHCETMSETPRCVVVLTDLMGTFPAEPPPYPVLWVVWGEYGEAPFGEVVRVK